MNSNDKSQSITAEQDETYCHLMAEVELAVTCNVLTQQEADCYRLTGAFDNDLNLRPVEELELHTAIVVARLRKFMARDV